MQWNQRRTIAPRSGHCARCGRVHDLIGRATPALALAAGRNAMYRSVCRRHHPCRRDFFAFAQGDGIAQRGSIVSTVTPDVIKDLAPTGKLRASINLGNPVLAQGTPEAPRGVTPELARELAKRLGVPAELVPFDAAGKAFEALKAGRVDVVFLAIEPVRAADIDFTAPYVIIEGVYMVPKDSALKHVSDFDRAGIRISVNKASAYDLFLTRTLKHATLVRSESGVDTFVKDKLEAAAGVKQPLVAYAKAHPQVRVIGERFMEIQQAMGTAKGRTAGARYLSAFIEEMKANGFVADALKRANQPDAAVAPPAAR
jgi:polar amino acid transport system substrate-binding protein